MGLELETTMGEVKVGIWLEFLRKESDTLVMIWEQVSCEQVSRLIGSHREKGLILVI